MAYQVISANRNDTVIITLSITIDDVPVNLTGASLRFQARKSRLDTTPLISKTSLSGITSPVPASGIAYVQIDPADTSSTTDFPNDEVVTLWWDAELAELSGKVTTVDQGKLVITPDITR